MIGIILITHNNLAGEFIDVVEHILGKQQYLEKICVAAGDDMELRRKDIVNAVKKVDNGKGVAILTDMFGGTPSNLAISVTNNDNIEVIAGVNLPMLIKLVSVRSGLSLSEAMIEAQESGRKYINITQNIINNNVDSK